MHNRFKCNTLDVHRHSAVTCVCFDVGHQCWILDPVNHSPYKLPLKILSDLQRLLQSFLIRNLVWNKRRHVLWNFLNRVAKRREGIADVTLMSVIDGNKLNQA